MNTEDKDIDRIFREAANEMSVPFHESYWDEIEALLPTNPTRKRGVWFWSVAASLAIILTVLGWNQFANKSNSEEIKYASTRLEKKDHTQSKSLEKASQRSNQQKEKNQNLNGKKSTENFISKSLLSTHTYSQNKDALKRTNSSVIESQKIKLLNENRDELTHNDRAKEQVNNLNLNKLNKLEQIETVLAQQTSVLPNFKKSKNTIYVEAFGGVAQALTQSEPASPSLTYGIGAGISHKINSFALRAGINLRALNTNNTEIKRNSKVYSFSSVQFQQNLNYGQMYYADIPLEIAYTKEKQSFYIGVSPSVLLTSRLKFETRQDEALTDKGAAWNQSLGLNRFHLNAVLGYELELQKHWSAGARISNALLHPLKKEVFSAEKQAFPFQVNLSLKYTL